MKDDHVTRIDVMLVATPVTSEGAGGTNNRDERFHTHIDQKEKSRGLRRSQ